MELHDVERRLQRPILALSQRHRAGAHRLFHGQPTRNDCGDVSANGGRQTVADSTMTRFNIIVLRVASCAQCVASGPTLKNGDYYKRHP
jgi:hypothetical protein